MGQAIEFLKRFKQELGVVVAASVGLLMAFGVISRDHWEMAAHLVAMTTGVALRADIGVKGWRTHAGFLALGINGILAGTDVLEPTQWLAIDGIIASLTGASLNRAIRKATNGNGGTLPPPAPPAA